MSHNFTVADVVNQVRNLAAGSPEYVYWAPEEPAANGMPGCSYVNGVGGKGCIVGQALTNLGVTKDELAKHEGTRAGVVVPYLLGVEEGTQKLAWLDAVQARQDDGCEWAEAVAHADAHYPLAVEATA